MSVQFKLTSGLPPEQVETILRKLRAGGMVPSPLFPNAKRPSLEGIYSMPVDTDNAVQSITDALMEFGDAIEYVEKGVTRTLK